MSVVLPFSWIDVREHPPHEGMDCIVLTACGTVCRAVAARSCQNGFCTATHINVAGSRVGGKAVSNPVTHYVPFLAPDCHPRSQIEKLLLEGIRWYMPYPSYFWMMKIGVLGFEKIPALMQDVQGKPESLIRLGLNRLRARGLIYKHKNRLGWYATGIGK